MAKTYTIEDPETKQRVSFMWDGNEPPTDADMDTIFQEARQYKQQATSLVPDNTTGPEWAGKYPNLYGAYGAGRELLRTGIETAGQTGGAALGALLPIPGSTFAGAGLGYAGAKRGANLLLGDNVDTSLGGIAGDVALGAGLQLGGGLIGKIPFLKNILSPQMADVGMQKPIVGTQPLAYSMMEKAMKVPPSVKEGIREKAINTALETGTPVTKAGLQRTKGVLDDLIDQMDMAIVNSPNKNNIIRTDDVMGPVKSLKDWASMIADGGKTERKIQDYMDKVVRQFGPEITVENAQAIKQATNSWLKKNAYGQLQTASVESQKQMVRGLRDRIAQEVPEIAGINAKYSDMKMLETALERAVNRTGNWDWLQLTPMLAAATVGGATGSIGKAIESAALLRILKSPNVQSTLAIMMKKYGAGQKANVMANTIAETVYNKMSNRNQAIEEDGASPLPDY